MTNLEYYANENKLKTNRLFCFNAYICKHGKECSGFACSSCELCRNMNECVKSMLAEHKEPIKLKQWEKDLLTVFMEFAGIQGNQITLNNALLISPMLRKGHFKGVTDTSMKIYEIIENCEVVE